MNKKFSIIKGVLIGIFLLIAIICVGNTFYYVLPEGIETAEEKELKYGVFKLLILILGFVIGSFISGLIIKSDVKDWKLGLQVILWEGVVFAIVYTFIKDVGLWFLFLMFIIISVELLIFKLIYKK